MSEHDAVRRALDDLASGAPGPVPGSRKGAVMARVSAAQRRRMVAQAALGGLLLVTVSAGAVRYVGSEPVNVDSVYEQPTPAAEPSDVPSSPPPAKPSPPAKPVPAKQPVAAPPASKPVGAPDPAKPKPKPEPEPKPEYTATSKPTAPKPVSGSPLVVDFYSATGSPRAGAPVDLKVKALDGAGRLLEVVVAYGDGTSKTYQPAGECGAGVDFRKYFTHTYAKQGAYTPKVTVTTGGCGAATETATRSIRLEVGAAAPAGNGPAKPAVSAEQSVSGAALDLLVSGSDADGFVKKFWIDWGDGSPATYVGPRSLDGCRPGEPTQWQQAREHTYGGPGSYQVTVTVMSTDCDGGTGQTATTTLTVTVE